MHFLNPMKVTYAFMLLK